MGFEGQMNSSCNLFSSSDGASHFQQLSDRKGIWQKASILLFFKICFALFRQGVTVCQQGLNDLLHVIISLMKKNTVVIIYIRVMLQLFWNPVQLVFVKINNQFGYACVI